MSSRSSESLPNPISIDISRAFASLADPLIATRDTRHGAYDPHDATASSPTSPVDDSPPRSSTAGVGLPRDRGEPGGVPLILRLRRAAMARGRRRTRGTDDQRRSRPRTRLPRHIHGRHRRDAVARRAVAGVSSRASATSRHARVFFRRDAAGFFNSRRAGSCASARDASRARKRGGLAAAGHAAALARLQRPRPRGGRVVGGRTLGRRRIRTLADAHAHSVVDRDAFAFLRPPARTRR